MECGTERLGWVDVTRDDFIEAVLDAGERPVLVDFWAPWCGPCRALEPALEALAVELRGRALIVRVNVDEEERLARAANIRQIPTLAVFHRGEVVSAMTGVQPLERLRAILTAHLEG